MYVEEYESGAVPMEGVGTSTAGFVCVAKKGPVIGKPQLVTSFSDYIRVTLLLSTATLRRIILSFPSTLNPPIMWFPVCPRASL